MDPMNPKDVGAPLLGAVQQKQKTPQEILAEIGKRASESISQQKKQLGETQKELNKLKMAPKKRDPRIFAALADQFTGSNLLGLANQMHQQNDTSGRQAQLEKMIQSQQGRITDDELGMLRAQMQGAQKPGMTLQDKLAAQTAAKKDVMDHQFDLNKRLKMMGIKAKQPRQSSEPGAPDVSNLTKGQDAADRKFGGEMQDWVAGGFSSVEGNLKALEGSLADLQGDDEVGKTIMPEWVRVRTNPKSVAVEQNIAKVVFQSLKKILGGQFAKEEGERLVQQSYDSRLPDTANSKKVQQSIDVLRTMADAKQRAVEYFDKYGTLKGFAGSKANNMKEFHDELKQKYLKGKADKPSKMKMLEEKYGL